MVASRVRNQHREKLKTGDGREPWQNSSPFQLFPSQLPPSLLSPWFVYSVLLSMTQKIHLLPKWVWVTCSKILTNTRQTFSQHISSCTPLPLGLFTLLSVAFPRYWCRMTTGQTQLLSKDHKPQCWSWRTSACHWTPLYQIHVFRATAEQSPQKPHLQLTGTSTGRLLRPWGQTLMCIPICNAQFPFYTFSLN